MTAPSFLVLGGLVAADHRLPDGVVTVLASTLGALHGWLNGAGIAVRVARSWIAAIGLLLLGWGLRGAS